MDSLILTFNKEQLSIYYELLEKKDLELNFDTALSPTQDYSLDVLDIEVLSILNEMTELIKFKKQKTMFSSSLTQEKLQEFIPIYYKVINNIWYHQRNVRNEIVILSCLICDVEKSIADINQRYANFLPYKAALYNRPGYVSRIKYTDKQFKANIEKANGCKKALLSYFDDLIKLCDIISDFFKKSSKASDEPKFKSFNTYDFFLSVDSFIEQLKALSK